MEEPSTPKVLCALFEKELLRIIHDPAGHFGQVPYIVPSESRARKSALSFISATVDDVHKLLQVPFDKSQNACGQFLQGAIKDREEKKVETEEEGEGISLEEQEQDNCVRAVWASLEPKYRNQEQASSSTSPAAEVRDKAGPPSRGQRSEPPIPVQRATEPSDSESDQTAQPPSTDYSSAEQDPILSGLDLEESGDQPVPDVAGNATSKEK